MALFLASALILFLLKDVTCQNLPYRTITNRDDNSNNITLRCIDRFGVEVPGASFYRNGQQPITNSSCLMAYPTGSSSVLNLTLASQECDSYFSCGVNGTLSKPEPLYACPVMNNSDRTELVEKGMSVLLTCDFYPSPINRYETTWYRNPGRFQTELNSTMDLQSYTENNPRQMTTYACEIDPVKDCFNNAASPTGPIITIYLKERYVMPMITKDLNYTRHNSGSGGVFSVSTSGTNLTHKWYKNDRLINGTGAGILAFGNDSVRVEDSNGLLRITYEVSNVDYDNMTQTTRQTFGLYTNVSQDESASTKSEGQVLTIALGVLVPIGTLSILVNIILVVFICFKSRISKAQAPPPKEGIELPAAEPPPNQEEVDKSSMPPSRQQSDSKQEADCSKCQYEKSLKPMKRILLSASSLVRDCETNFDFLHCLTVMLTDVLSERYFDNECTIALKTMRKEMEELMESRKPPRQTGTDGTGERMTYDGSHGESMASDGQHEQDDKIYEKYEELYNLFDNCIKNVAPDQDKGQNLVN